MAAIIKCSTSLDRKWFAPVRNDPWLKQHSKLLLLAWRANMDLQPVLNWNAAIKYVSKYTSKPESHVRLVSPSPVNFLPLSPSKPPCRAHCAKSVRKNGIRP